MRRMLRRSTLLICLFALALPMAAHAQSSPFAPLPPASTAPAPTPTTTTASSSSGNGGLAGWQQVLIFGAGGILLLGIAWAIVRDARSVAPTIDTDTQLESRERREEDIKRRKAKNRAAAKRSRAARKRNR
jgi:D-arabinose 1-dehydrogenase-like Zn-dependent alcohol dehydrogenase